MNKKLILVNIAFTTILIFSSFTAISNGEIISTEDSTLYSKSIENDIFKYNWTGCFNLTSLKDVNSFKVYVHIPIVHTNQAPLIIHNIWTEPENRVEDFKIVKNYSGKNSLLEVTVSYLNKDENLKLFWSISTIVKANNYGDIPIYIKIAPIWKLPQEVKKWLCPTPFVQSNNLRIRLYSLLLSGKSNNVVDIASKIADFTGNTIEYIGGKNQDALTTLKNKYGVCTGKANLAAALLRARGIPARVLMVYPTHYIVEYYAHPYGWIKLESDVGIMPVSDQSYTVSFCVHPREESSLNCINGQKAYSGVPAYWGASNNFVRFDIDYSSYSINFTYFVTNEDLIEKSLNLTETIWNYYTNYLGKNLTIEKKNYFINATKFQNLALECFENKNIQGYIENLTFSYEEYLKLEEKIRGIAIGSDIIGDESSISELLTFINNSKCNMVIVDFGWITWSWYNTDFNAVGNFINQTKSQNTSTWLMYRPRTLAGQYLDLPHLVHRDGSVSDIDLCLYHNKSSEWAISWSHRLLENFSNVDGMILYNPRIPQDYGFSDYSINRFKEDTGSFLSPKYYIPGGLRYYKWMEWKTEKLTEFINLWKGEIKQINENLSTGIVLNSPIKGAFVNGHDVSEIGDILDIIFPFVPLNNVSDVVKYTEEIVVSTTSLVDCEVITDIKMNPPYINTDEDIINAMKSSIISNGNGYFIWCYDYLISENHNLSKIIDAYSGIYN